MLAPPRTFPDSRPPRLRALGGAGFTLLEVSLGLAFLLVGLLAVTSTAMALQRLRKSDQEGLLAERALGSVTADVQILARSSLDDSGGWAPSVLASYGPGGSIGERFDVDGLSPWPGEPSVGTIRVVTDETLSDPELGVDLGMPRDLDDDGMVDNPDVSTSAKLLPVVVRLRWAGSGGRCERVRGFYVAGF